jgi:riboflavin biosynthesis pyrimidine reductase
MTNKPFVVCHMLTSLNGKIDGSFFGNSASGTGLERFGKIRRGYNCDAVLFGTKTMQGFARGLVQPSQLKGRKPAAVEDWTGPEGEQDQSYLVALDPMGTLAYESHFVQRGSDPAQHVIEVVSEKVSGAYLNYLQEIGISYIVAGKTELDGKVILEKLNRLFGIERVALCGGGITNGTFLKDGLIDEISLVVVPVIEGSAAGTAFDEFPGHSLSGETAFSLKSVDVLSKDTLWLRFAARKS